MLLVRFVLETFQGRSCCLHRHLHKGRKLDVELIDVGGGAVCVSELSDKARLVASSLVKPTGCSGATIK